MILDLRYAVRGLLRSPGFAVAAILTLSLGIGAATAIFSVADAVLLRSLPYPNADRLVVVWDSLPKLGLNRLTPKADTAEEYRKLDGIFEMTGGIYPLDRIVTGAAGAERIPGMFVTRDVFAMLRPRAAVGRTFTAGDYDAGAPSVAILGHSFFLRRYAGNPAAIGTTIEMDGRAFVIVGVMPSDFDFSLRGNGTDVWTPKALDKPRDWGNATRMIARLRPGVTLKAAQAAIDAASRQAEEAHHPYTGPHGEDAGYRGVVVSLHEQLLGDFRTATLILLIAVGAVLLVACVNVANLLLVRAVAREKETAVRQALGATRGRLIGQWLTESAVLALAGGSLGALAAVWGTRILVRLSPQALPGMTRVAVDGRTLVFALAVSCVVCLVFGLAPGFGSVRNAWGARGNVAHNRRAASILVMAEVGLAIMLMIGAGLLLKSYAHLRQVDPGFNPAHLLTFQTQFPATVPLSKARLRTFYADLQQKLEALPGVTSATLGFLPVRGPNVNAGGGDPFQIKGRPYGSSGPVGQFGNMIPVALDYFRTFQIPLLQGRVFEQADSGDAAATVVVNQTLARSFFPRGAIGEQIGWPGRCTGSNCEPTWLTIVGVVADVKTFSLDREALPQIYEPLARYPFPGASVAVRTMADPLAVARDASALIHSMDANVPVYDVKTMEERVEDSVGQPRFEAMILGFFAASALFLAAIGIFGVVAHSTAQRTQEIGIRMALGADSARVVRSVVWEGLRPVLAGIVIGVGGAIWISKALTSTLFHVAPTDPASFLAASATLLGVAAAACFAPARRASRIDPMEALRAE